MSDLLVDPARLLPSPMKRSARFTARIKSPSCWKPSSGRCVYVAFSCDSSTAHFITDTLWQFCPARKVLPNCCAHNILASYDSSATDLTMVPTYLTLGLRYGKGPCFLPCAIIHHVHHAQCSAQVGAIFQRGQVAGAPFVVRSNNLITGQNSASATALSQQVVDALSLGVLLTP